jgi:hypothetical protein
MKMQAPETEIICCSSDGVTLVFGDAGMHAEYEAEMLAVKLKYYGKIRDKYGVWAGNQGKYIPDARKLNTLDSRYMENLFAALKE